MSAGDVLVPYHEVPSLPWRLHAPRVLPEQQPMVPAGYPWSPDNDDTHDHHDNDDNDGSFTDGNEHRMDSPQSPDNHCSFIVMLAPAARSSCWVPCGTYLTQSHPIPSCNIMFDPIPSDLTVLANGQHQAGGPAMPILSYPIPSHHTISHPPPNPILLTWKRGAASDRCPVASIPSYPILSHTITSNHIRSDCPGRQAASGWCPVVPAPGRHSCH